jgi:hypothetical protein
MHPTASSNCIPTRVILHLTVVVLVFIAAAVQGGCSKEPTNQGVADQQQARPASSPIPSPSAEPSKETEDTIIVIKDGSVEITLDEKCKLEGLVDKRFVCQEAPLGSVTAGPTAGSQPDCPDINSTSEIKIDAGGEGKTDIDVKGKSNGTVEVDFDRDRYKPCGKYKYCNDDPDAHIWLVRLKNGSKKTCRACNPGDKCEVEFYRPHR